MKNTVRTSARNIIVSARTRMISNSGPKRSYAGPFAARSAFSAATSGTWCVTYMTPNCRVGISSHEMP